MRINKVIFTCIHDCISIFEFNQRVKFKYVDKCTFLDASSLTVMVRACL